MNLKRMMNLKNVNIWLIANAFGLNIIYTMVVLFFSLSILGTPEGVTILMLACFTGPFIIGWVITMMAGDGRGPTYGVYGGLASGARSFLPPIQPE
jgi:hypothetical protein